MGKKDQLDKFYTRANVAKQCVSILDMMSPLSGYDCIVEPSAGNGSFLKYLPAGTIALDIAPEAQNIELCDFFEFDANRLNGEKILFVGNPPFGIRSSIAKKFIEHAIELNGITIAFILPDTFAKLQNQRIFPQNWRLIRIEKLAPNSFSLCGQDYHVPCSFFIWTCDDTVYPNTNLRETKSIQPKCYRFMGRNDLTADFSLNGNSGKIKDLSQITNPKAEHYIKVSDGYDVASIRAKMGALNFTFRSSANGGVSWINRDDINHAFLEQYGDL